MKTVERWLGRTLIALLALVLSATAVKYVPVYTSTQIAYESVTDLGTGKAPLAPLFRHLHIKIDCEKVERLTAVHAITNAVFFLAYSILFVSAGVLVCLGSIIGIPCLIIWGVCTGDWGTIGLAFLLGLMLALASLLMPILAILYYFVTLFQCCTPAYFILWMPIGLISFGSWMILGWAGVLVPTAPDAVGHAVIDTGTQIIEVPVRAVRIFFR